MKTLVGPQSVYGDKKKVRIPKSEYLELAGSVNFSAFLSFLLPSFSEKNQGQN